MQSIFTNHRLSAQGRAVSRRGTAAIEMLLVLLVIFSFGLLGWSNMKVRRMHVKVRQETHRDVFAETVRLFPDRAGFGIPPTGGNYSPPDTGTPLIDLDSLFTIETPKIDTDWYQAPSPFPLVPPLDSLMIPVVWKWKAGGPYAHRKRLTEETYWDPPEPQPRSFFNQAWLDWLAADKVQRRDLFVWRERYVLRPYAGSIVPPRLPDPFRTRIERDPRYPGFRIFRGDFDPVELLARATLNLLIPVEGTELGGREFFTDVLGLPEDRADQMTDLSITSLTEGELNLLDFMEAITGNRPQFPPAGFPGLPDLNGLLGGGNNGSSGMNGFVMPSGPFDFMSFTSLTISWPAFGDNGKDFVDHDAWTSEGDLDGKFGSDEDWEHLDLPDPAILGIGPTPFHERPGQGVPRKVEMYTGPFGANFDRTLGAPRVSLITPCWTYMISPVVPTTPVWNVMLMRNWYGDALSAAIDQHYTSGDADADDDGFRNKLMLEDHD